MSRSWMNARLIVAGAVAALLLLTFVLRPHFSERWGLYASSHGGPPASYPLFLDPFPTEHSCELEARYIIANGGHALCRRRIAFETGTREDDLLWAAFVSPASSWLALCESRLRSALVRR